MTGRPTLESILSGDLAEDDGPAPFQDYDENSFHVVIGSGVDATGVLDGFTIAGGNANGVEPNHQGGGLYIEGGSPTFANCAITRNRSGSANGGGGFIFGNSTPSFTNCMFSVNTAKSGAGLYSSGVGINSPHLTNCVFNDNFTPAGGNGGGMVVGPGSTVLSGCTFTNNSATNQGGGVYVASTSAMMLNCTFNGNTQTAPGPAHGGGAIYNTPGSTPTITGCTFTSNSALYGGAGIYNDGASPTGANCTFTGNAATGSAGGAIFSTNGASPEYVNCGFFANTAVTDGGVLFGNASSQTTFVNCVFSGNSAARWGGALYSENTGGASGFAAYNCSFGRQNAASGGVVYQYGGSSTMRNCILWNDNLAPVGPQIFLDASGSVDVQYSTVLGGYSGDGNIDADPLFVDADGADDIVGTEDDDLRLLPGSPCIDAGSNSDVPADTLDLDGDGNTAEPTPLDLDGNPRFIDVSCTPDTGVGPAPVVDMGAYEFVESDCDGDGLGDVCDELDVIEFSGQPQSQSACAGDAAVFGVAVLGDSPFSYQWRLNGVALPGETGITLLIDPVTPLAAGMYDCVVTNACGSAVSGVAELVVETVAGDLNFDGSVNQSDLNLVLASFGLCPGDAGYFAPAGLLGGDACVTQDDLNVVLANFELACR